MNVMGNVIKLPDRAVREWLIVEKTLRETLASGGAEPDLVNYVCEEMRPLILKYAASDFRSDASMSPDEVMKAVNDWVHALIAGMMTEVAIREIELYRLRGNK